MLNKLLNFLKINLSVYVVAAYDTDRDKIKEIKVLWLSENAADEYRRLQAIYGTANVVMASRGILTAQDMEKASIERHMGRTKEIQAQAREKYLRQN